MSGSPAFIFLSFKKKSWRICDSHMERAMRIELTT